MHRFQFTLEPVDAITPWLRDGAPELSWFALTDGRFWIDLGEDELFRYTPEILERWGETDPHPSYQGAAFARDLLESLPFARAAVPAPGRASTRAEESACVE